MKRLILGLCATLLVLSCEGKGKMGRGESEAGVAHASPSQGSAAVGGGGAALASIGNEMVTMSDLMNNKQVPHKTKNELYEVQKRALDDYLFEALVAKEATKQGKSAEEVMKKEVDGKTKKVSDRDVKSFYDELAKGRQGVPPLDKLADRIKEKLTQDNAAERKEKYFDELTKRYKVAYLISRPKVNIAVGDNPVKGTEKAPVTIVEFSDFECPFCKRVEPTIDKVMKEYRGKVKLYFRDFPLGFHQNAKPAAHASRCAGEQGKYWEYNVKLFADQKLGDENYNKYAQELKLNVDKFKACNQSGKFNASIEQDMKDGSEMGVTGTPAFFVNGVFLSGAQPYEKFKSVIDDELKMAKGGSKASGTP